MLNRIFAGLTLAIALFGAAGAQTPPTVSGLPLKDATGASRTEGVETEGAYFYPFSLIRGWNATTAASVPWAMETNGSGDVTVIALPPISFASGATVNLATGSQVHDAAAESSLSAIVTALAPLATVAGQANIVNQLAIGQGTQATAAGQASLLSQLTTGQAAQATAANQVTANTDLAAIETSISALITAIGAPVQAGATSNVACVSGCSTGAVAQGSSTTGETGPLMQAATVAGDQTYTGGQTDPLTLDSKGRLRVGLSSAGSVAPGTAGSMSDLMGCVYSTAGWTFTTAQQGACQFDALGGVIMHLDNTGLPLPANAAQETGGNLAAMAASTASIASNATAIATNTSTTAAKATALATALGTMGDTACATDAGTCDVIQLLERENARLTSLIAAVGSPLQTGATFNVACTSGCSGGSGGGGAVTAAAGAFALGSIVDLGTKGDAACSADSGTCDLIQLIERTNARLTSLITALGSPAQAGATVTANNATPFGLETISYITAASGTASGAAHTLASALNTSVAAGCIVATVYSDQAGTAEVDETADGTTYYPAIAPQTMTAATYTTIKAPVMGIAAKVKITNGATAETVLRVMDGLMATCGG
jgi:hypothetical protein